MSFHFIRELGHGPEFYTLDKDYTASSIGGFTTEIAKAIQFARRRDAEDFQRKFLVGFSHLSIGETP